MASLDVGVDDMMIALMDAMMALMALVKMAVHDGI
jgi:hypothetical protein